MDREQKIRTILDRQLAGIEAVLVASQSLLDEADSFNMERLETLVEMRSDCIEELALLDKERKLIALEDGEQIVVPEAPPALKTALENLSGVDELLQDMMRRRQVAIINSMASMRNNVNFNILGKDPQMARQLLDVMR